MPRLRSSLTSTCYNGSFGISLFQQPRRWTGVLARMTRAKALRASNSIEDINVSQEDALSPPSMARIPVEADRETWRAVVGYQEAMTYILQRCKDDAFRFSARTLFWRSIHDLLSDLDANPGNLRRGWVGVGIPAQMRWCMRALSGESLNHYWTTSLIF